MAQQKVSFKKWWKNITGTKAVKGLFHIDLVDSIVYAGVPVNYTVNGQTRCQGYIPTIVSRCGWLLKEQATKTKGIFRVSGSAKRVSELQLIFDTPPNYGSQLDWTGFTIHDASNVLRRYLNHLPDPVITLEYYEKFRDVHRNLTDDEEKIAAYQDLISKLPPPHSCLLMYLLDLLALFAHHSDENLMDSKNLASVFQPGVLSHPNHAMSPGEYMTSAAVLKFLIDHQSSFTLPQPAIDEDDEEMANFGLGNSSAQQTYPGLGSSFHGGYVNASDHKRIHDTMVDPGVSFEAEDAVHILGSGIKRNLSLHRPIIPHSTLPGNTPQRSKSTNSSTSSHHSNHSSLFSSAFLARRRSHRNSKTSSRIILDSEANSLAESLQEQDLSDISETHRPAEDKLQRLGPKSSAIRKANTSPLTETEPSEFSSYLSRRKQMKGEGLHREPSVFCQTIEIQFPAPIIDSPSVNSSALKSSAPIAPGISSKSPTIPRGNRTSQNMSERHTRTYLQKAPQPSTTAHVHIPDPPLRQHDGAYPPSLGRPAAGQRQLPEAGQGPSRGQLTSDYHASAAQRPVNPGMPILRAKSNPGDLTATGSRNQNQAMEKFMGLFTGKHKESDSGAIRDASSISKDLKKDKKRESLTDKQRKYRSQELPPAHLHGPSSGPASSPASSWRGAPAHGAISEQHEGAGAPERAYTQPPPPLPHQQRSPSPPSARPTRPAPPPPEGSLMDLLDPHALRPVHAHFSGHSPPASGESRSASPAHSAASPSRYHLPTNPSFASTSSAASLPGGDRLYHGRRGLVSQGSSGSLEGTLPRLHSEENLVPRPRPPRLGHSPQLDSSHDPYQPQHSQQYQQHLSPYSSSSSSLRPSHPHPNQSPHLGYDHGGKAILSSHPFDPLSPPPQRARSRSRQGSFGSNNDLSDTNTPSPPTPAKSKERERRLPRDGSTTSLRGDITPPRRTRSNSSKDTSPVHSPLLKPLSRAGSSNQIGQGTTSPGQSYHQQQQYHGSSPLAEGQSSVSATSSYTSPPPSSRARSRAQSRDEPHHRPEAGPPHRAFERSRSAAAGLAITSPAPILASSPSSSPSIPTPSTFASHSSSRNLRST
ncbi:unnamed protein product [Mortierella alpina]